MDTVVAHMRRPEQPLKSVARNVRRLRLASGTSLDGLAASSGVGRSTLARLEAGHANPTIETLFAIADALHEIEGDRSSGARGIRMMLTDRDRTQRNGIVRAIGDCDLTVVQSGD